MSSLYVSRVRSAIKRIRKVNFDCFQSCDLLGWICCFANWTAPKITFIVTYLVTKIQVIRLWGQVCNWPSELHFPRSTNRGVDLILSCSFLDRLFGRYNWFRVLLLLSTRDVRELFSDRVRDRRAENNIMILLTNVTDVRRNFGPFLVGLSWCQIQPTGFRHQAVSPLTSHLTAINSFCTLRV